MCLAVPGKVLEINNENGLLMGKIDYSGTTNMACLAYVPEVAVGQYVIVHAGFALSILDEDEAKKTLALFDEIQAKSDEQDIDLFGNKTGNSN